MSIVIVVAFFALFITAALLFARKPATQDAADTLYAEKPLTLPDGVYLAQGHSTAVMQGESLNIGAGPLAQHLLGRIDRIDLCEQKHVKKGETIAVLFGAARALRLRAPADGEIEAVNAPLRSKPTQLGAGWLVRMKPDQGSASLKQMRVGDAARTWMDQEMVRLRDSLASLQGQQGMMTSLADGGTPVSGLARSMDRAQWNQLEATFFNIEA